MLPRSTWAAEGTTLPGRWQAVSFEIKLQGAGAYLHRRLYRALREALLSGKIPAGAALPSSRKLARQLGISRNTVLAAYDALADDGLAIARRGSGTRAQAPQRNQPLAPTLLDYVQFCREAGFPIRSQRFTDPDGNPLYLHQ